MLILEDLWDGKVAPSEREYPKDKEYSKLAREGGKYLDEVLKELSPAGKKAFD